MKKKSFGRPELFLNYDKLTSMGLYLKQNEPRSQLQSKIASDLADRMNKRALDKDGEAPTVQPAILDDQRPTSPLAWVWMVLGIIALGGIIFVLAK